MSVPSAPSETACPVEVEAVRDETPSIRTLRLRWSGAPLPFRPGQAVRLSFPDEPAVVRSYSIASSPLDAGCLEISVGSAGRFSARLFAATPGAALTVRGTGGAWLYEDHVREAVMISGGSGLAPFRSMLRYMLQKGLDCRALLLHSSRSPEEILYRAELERWAEHPSFRVHVTVTRPQASRQPWSGMTGRIDLAKLRSLVPDLQSADYYLCGPNALVTSLAGALAAQGVPAPKLHYEAWG